MYHAEMVADSISPKGHRISTMKVTMPRIILAEFNTHRMFSRNSASSRAIPLHKMIQAVKENPFIPLKWMKNHSGMQGTQYFEERETFQSSNPFDPNASGVPGVRQNDEGRWVSDSGLLDIIPHMQKKWLWLRDINVQEAEALNDSGVLYHPNGDTSKLTGKGNGLTKQMCNRLLEAWMWQTVLVTATEYENFFALRVDPAAEIHMQHIADLMLQRMNLSTPKFLNEGEWHMPYGDKALPEDLIPLAKETHCTELDLRIKIAVARCAQVSYTVVGEEGKPLDLAKLVALHDRLLKSGHMSPFEHVARCMNSDEYNYSGHTRYKHREKNTLGQAISELEPGWCGNFRGWIQYRKLLPNENRSDNRLIKLA